MRMAPQACHNPAHVRGASPASQVFEEEESPVNEQQLQQFRKPYMKEIRFVQTLMYVGTAAFFAAAASDFVSQAPASALGNLGLVLILVRLYVLSGLIVAKAKNGDVRWIEAEVDYAEQRYPWADQTGRAGWWILLVAVVLQLMGAMG